MESTPGNPAPLQFETATPQTPGREAAAAGGVTCAGCQRTIERAYFDVNGASVCETCRDTIERHAETPRGWGVLARAAIAGLVAAVLGAILYYAVIAITNFEIGIVAIAIGYMVGYGIRMGTGGRGGRRFQILALVLTYWSVGLAYAPLVFRPPAAADAQEKTAETPGETRTVTGGAGDETAERGSVAFSLMVVFGLTFALPVMMVIGSLPGGLLSAAIIAFGMHQAWRMTGTPALQISGPYRIGATG